MATLVRCLSLSIKPYIDYPYLCYRIYHGRTLQTLPDRDKSSMDYTRCKVHISSYRISSLRRAGDSGDISVPRRAREDYPYWMSSTLRCQPLYWRWRCLFPGTWRSRWLITYRFHDPKHFVIVLGALELLEEDDVLSWELEGGREEIVLVWFLFIVLLI